MIVDKIENCGLYKGIGARIEKALQILGSKEIATAAEGKHEVDGDKLFYLVQKYTTKPRNEGQLEAHKKYIDIQFVVDGSESIFVENISAGKIAVEFNPDHDAAMYHVPKSYSDIRLTKGTFCVLFPQDGHLPCRTAENPSQVHKIVFKVAL